MTSQQEHNSSVKIIQEANAYLLGEVVPSTAAFLDELIPVFWGIGSFKCGGNRMSIGCLLHQKGVNLRLLGVKS